MAATTIVPTENRTRIFFSISLRFSHHNFKNISIQNGSGLEKYTYTTLELLVNSMAFASIQVPYVSDSNIQEFIVHQGCCHLDS